MSIPFTRYWVNTDAGDPLGSIGCGYRTVRVTFRKTDLIVRGLHDDETSVRLRFDEWNHIPHVEAAEHETMTEVIGRLNAYTKETK